MNTTVIYVSLLDENVKVWRPVQASHLGEDKYLIADQPYDRETEHWEFEPGNSVICALTETSTGIILAAVARCN